MDHDVVEDAEVAEEVAEDTGRRMTVVAEDTGTFWYPGMDEFSDDGSPRQEILQPLCDAAAMPAFGDLADALTTHGTALQTVIKWLPLHDWFCAALAHPVLHAAVCAQSLHGLRTSIGGVSSSLERLLWAYGLPQRPHWWNEELCARLATNGILPGLKWARQKGCTWGRSTCNAAAGGGHLEVLQWLRANGCPWNANTCYAAAGAGHLEVLKWAQTNGCPWNANTCYAAARGGHLEVLEWAHSNGCRWNTNTCSAAAGGGHLEILQWARANGCPCDSNACYAAANAGHLHIVQWCRANGYVWEESQASITKERPSPVP